MESRQSYTIGTIFVVWSLPASRMESRQSCGEEVAYAQQVCQPQGWNQGKAGSRGGPTCGGSLPASRMESRQSWVNRHEFEAVSLPASRMESRQSDGVLFVRSAEVCQPQGWNQGKARLACAPSYLGVCQPQGWNQGKATRPRPGSTAGVCQPQGWNQGKAETNSVLLAIAASRSFDKTASCNSTQAAKTNFGNYRIVSAGLDVPAA